MRADLVIFATTLNLIILMIQTFVRRGAITIAILCFFYASLVTLSSYTTHRIGDEMWKMMGITKSSGTEAVRESFLKGYFAFYSARNARNLATSDKAAIAKDLLTYTKCYISSPEFAAAYQKERAEAKPEKPTQNIVRTKEEIQKEQIKETEKSIAELEANMKTVSADVKKTLEPVLVMLKNTLKEYKDPNNAMFQIIADSDKQASETNQSDYKENLAQWQIDYPENPKQMIKARLQKLLDLTDGIDYNAALGEKYGKKRFVNPEYESKNPEWKQGYRAGKEITEMTRSFAKQWLMELK